MSTREAKTDILQGTLDLMVLRTLATMGAQHGFGLAQRIQQISGGALDLNQGTLYPRCCGWSIADGSARGGASRTITGAPSFTKSPPRDGGRWKRIRGLARTVAIMDASSA